MTIDLNQSQDVLRLKEDIDSLVRLDRVQDWQRRFSRWQISARKPGGYYEVRDLAGSGGAPDRGYYLTNLVLQGGGTLGLAHAGFIAGLEQGNFRFPGVAGTSAGAIVAMGLLVMRKQDISNGVADKVRDLVDQIPMDMFVDGPRVIRRLVKRLAARRSIRLPLFWPALFESFARLKNKRGLNSGEVFERWMKNILVEYGIIETADLERLMDGIAKDLSASKIGDQKPFERQNRPIEKNDVFKIISTAMPTGSKFCLPRDLKYLDPEYRELSPAKLVRKVQTKLSEITHVCIDSDELQFRIQSLHEHLTSRRIAEEMDTPTYLFRLNSFLSRAGARAEKVQEVSRVHCEYVLEHTTVEVERIHARINDLIASATGDEFAEVRKTTQRMNDQKKTRLLDTIKVAKSAVESMAARLEEFQQTICGKACYNWISSLAKNVSLQIEKDRYMRWMPVAVAALTTLLAKAVLSLHDTAVFQGHTNAILLSVFLIAFYFSRSFGHKNREKIMEDVNRQTKDDVRRVLSPLVDAKKGKMKSYDSDFEFEPIPLAMLGKMAMPEFPHLQSEILRVKDRGNTNLLVRLWEDGIAILNDKRLNFRAVRAS